MESLMRSYGERIQKVRCPPPSRARHDDQIVELFLHAWKEGRFSRDPDWLPQNRTNVEAIATDTSHTRVAIEHTRLFAYEHHKVQEERLRPIAERLETDPQLSIPGRRLDFRFQGKFLNRLPRTSRAAVQDELRNWAVRTAPGLAPSSHPYQFDVPFRLPGGRVLRTPVEIEVSERDESMRAVSVGGYLPPDPNRLVPVVRRALKTRLPKLVAAEADLRVFLLELPIMTDSPSKVIETVRRLVAEFPALDGTDYIVVANTFAWQTEDYILFWVWDRGVEDWTDILRPILTPAASRR